MTRVRAGAGGTPGSEVSDAPMSAPSCFGQVEAGLYRARSLTAADFAFVTQLSLKSLVYLSPELTRLQPFLNSQPNLNFVNLGLKVWRADASWRPVSEELIKEALEFILDANNLPCLIMCSSGRHETGTLVGCLRRLQSWNMASIIDEYRIYAGPKARFANEQFIELFDTDLVNLPASLPGWYIENMEMMVKEERELQRLIRTNIEVVNQSLDFPPQISPKPRKSMALISRPKENTLSRQSTPMLRRHVRSISEGFESDSSSIFPAFRRYLYTVFDGPLVSENVTYDPELSLIVDDD